MVVFCYGVEPPYPTWSVIGRDGATVRAATPVEGIERPSMIHDMALTPTYVVLVVGPLFVGLAAAMTGGSLLSCQPDEGTRVALIRATVRRSGGCTPTRSGCGTRPTPGPIPGLWDAPVSMPSTWSRHVLSG